MGTEGERPEEGCVAGWVRLIDERQLTGGGQPRQCTLKMGLQQPGRKASAGKCHWVDEPAWQRVMWTVEIGRDWKG